MTLLDLINHLKDVFEKEGNLEVKVWHNDAMKPMDKDKHIEVDTDRKEIIFA